MILARAAEHHGLLLAAFPPQPQSAPHDWHYLRANSFMGQRANGQVDQQKCEADKRNA
jgi:hypothetical protein